MEKLKTVDQYKSQKRTAQFGEYVITREAGLPGTREQAMGVLAKTIVEGMDICGYKSLNPKWIEKTSSIAGTCDPLNMASSLAGKITAELTATNEQYNHYLYNFASTALRDYQKEVGKRESLETWQGFLKFQINNLATWWHKKWR